MVLGVKGPKSIISTAIANALAQYFVVDAKSIESNLLHDTKIVLNNVLLRKQVARLPMNSAGKPTLITITGSVERVTFSWTWAVGANKDEKNLNAWVRDSKLTLKGLEFKAKLEYGTGDEELTFPPKTPEESTPPMDTSQQAAVKKQGGFQAFITNQVQMIIDSLDLDVEDFTFTIEVPPPLVKPEDSINSKELTSMVIKGTRALNVSNGRTQGNGGNKPADNSSAATTASPPTIIEQTVSFASLSLYVVETRAGSSATTTFPIVEPFSYGADMTRSSGQRFSGFTTGLTVIGKPSLTTTDDPPSEKESSGLVIHFGAPQLEALTELGIMLLPPPDNGSNEADGTTTEVEAGEESKADCTSAEVKEGDEPSDSPEKDEETLADSKETEDKPTSNGATAGDGNEPSDSVSEDENEESGTDDEGAASHQYYMADQQEDSVSAFILPMTSVSIVLDGSAKVVFPLLVISYEADGSLAEISADGCHMQTLSPDGAKQKGMSFQASGLKVAARPTIEVVINEINQIYVPDVIRLAKPIENPRFSLEGTTWSIDVDCIEAEVPINGDPEPAVEDSEPSEASASPSSTSDGPNKDDSRLITSNEKASEDGDSKDGDSGNVQTGSRPQVPFPIILSVNDIKVKNNKTLSEVKDLDVYLNPNPKRNSTDIALQVEEFNSSLVQCQKVNAFASLPLDQPDEIADFTFAAVKPRVSAGHSTKEWKETFKPRPVEKQPKPDANSKPRITKFPYASIAPLSLKVSWKGTGVTLRDTDVSIKPFKGDANTTSKDLIDYYVAACLSRVPGFISNADVLGVNVVDTTATTYGTWLGAGLFGNLGVAGGGVAAIAAVDGVKAAVHAGKASRNAENGASWKPGDLVRGIIYSAGQATKAGAFKRGRQDRRGDLIDFIVGTTSGTAGYVHENEAKLGGALGGGVGAIVFGTLVGGPVGGIVGGLVTGAVTKKTIENFEGRASKKPTQMLEGDSKTEEKPVSS